jgi:hypothetical protein
MKLKFALVALVALGGAALTSASASAMPIAPLTAQASNVETAALVCGPRGCVRTVPVYRRGYYRGYGYHRGYGWHRGYRRW